VLPSDELAAAGQRDVLEALLGEDVTGVGGHRDAVLAGRLHGLGGLLQPCVGAGRGQAGLRQQVLAVDQELQPGVGGHGQVVSPVAGEAQGVRVERAAAETVDDLAGGLRVEQAVGVHLPDLADGHAADDVGQGAGRGRGHDQLRQLVLVHTDDLDLDAGLLLEPVDDLLGRGHLRRQVLLRPHGDLVVRPAGTGPAGASGEQAHTHHRRQTCRQGRPHSAADGADPLVHGLSSRYFC
jgi:hypothetical protein